MNIIEHSTLCVKLSTNYGIAFRALHFNKRIFYMTRSMKKGFPFSYHLFRISFYSNV